MPTDDSESRYDPAVRPAVRVTSILSARTTWTFVAVLLAATLPVPAQELTPRAYWPAPIGTKVASIGYSYQKGEVVTDPSLPVEGAQSETHAAKAGYIQFFDLAGRTTSLSLELPYVDATYTGEVEGVPERRRLSGVSDARLRMAINLRGAPAMTREAFRAVLDEPEPLFGVSLLIQAQTGQYDPNRLLNLSSNRWAIKPEIGYIRQIRPGWAAEFALGAWLFTDNDDFQGQHREQEPLAAGEFHLVRPLRTGSWASLDLNFYHGGQTRVDGQDKDDRQSNSRIGVTIARPFKGRQLIRFSASTSLSTKTGGHYDSFILAYQVAWR